MTGVRLRHPASRYALRRAESAEREAGCPPKRKARRRAGESDCRNPQGLLEAGRPILAPGQRDPRGESGPAQTARGLHGARDQPRRLDHADRVSLSLLSRLFGWRDAIVIVRRSTVIRCHRLGWVIGTIRRECLDWMTPMSEAHVRTILRAWVAHYNAGRPHSALGPGVPDPPHRTAVFPRPKSRDRLATGPQVDQFRRAYMARIQRRSLHISSAGSNGLAR